MARNLPLSPYAFGAHGRDLIERYGPGFERDVETAWGSYMHIQDWGAFVRGFMGSVIEWLEGMG